MRAFLDFLKIVFFGFVAYLVCYLILFSASPELQAAAKLNAWSHSINFFENYKNEVGNWKRYKVDEELYVPQINENDFSYPYYMVKHSGGFENTFGDSITEKDTIHIIHNAWIFSFRENDEGDFQDTLSVINICKLQKISDTIKLKMYAESISNGDYISIDIKGNYFRMNYKAAYIFEYEDIVWDFHNTELTLSQTLPIEEGEILKGHLEFEIEETIFFKNINPRIRKKYFKGPFQVTVN